MLESFLKMVSINLKENQIPVEAPEKKFTKAQ